MIRRLADSAFTADKLKQALLACLNEKEYAEVTITELSRLAGINRTSFYLFFGSKDALFVELCHSIIAKWFQPFFDRNISRAEEEERKLFYELIPWLQEWAPALKRIAAVRTENSDGLNLLTEELESRMHAQKILQAEEPSRQKRFDLYIKLYSVGLVAGFHWWLQEGEGFEPEELHDMIDRLRNKGYFSILED